ncbi:MAG TPA: SymE family type I addiction module toxin [Edaphocola sp.]|nr:SymE family type I addiction module toxin [Edaphocola sp.]
MKHQHIRKAIIHARFRHRVESGIYVPWLNLNGLWLKDAGFNTGDAIEIVVKRKVLIIRKVTQSKEMQDRT